MKRSTIIAVVLTLGAAGFRLSLAACMPNDDEDDGRFYALIAANLLDHHGYSGEEEAPYLPTLVRVPGYPLFLAGLYSIFGRGNDKAVRLVQAGLDTLTCWLVALLALAWTPIEWEASRRRRAMLVALALAAVCPFTAVYVATIMTETWTILLVTALVLVMTAAIKCETRARAARLWVAAGVLGGLATMFRPDSALFVAGGGVALVATGLRRAIDSRRAAGTTNPSAARRIVTHTMIGGALLSLSFAAVLTPWTARNARVFGAFQPVAPPYANNPDEFAAIGYITWLRTWVDDERYVAPMEDALDLFPIRVDGAPESAFDSAEERERVAALYERYNNPPPEAESADEAAPEQQGSPPQNGGESRSAEASSDSSSAGDKPWVRMTPEIDAAFGVIAAERIARHPLRYYLGLPVKRALSLWFDTHSNYYPFQGELFPLSDIDPRAHQQYWLPLFLGLTWVYTILAAAGACRLWLNASARRWLLLLVLLIAPRMAFLSYQEHPEGRYMAEFFPLVAAVGSLVIVRKERQDAQKAPGNAS